MFKAEKQLNLGVLILLSCAQMSRTGSPSADLTIVRLHKEDQPCRAAARAIPTLIEYHDAPDRFAVSLFAEN